MFICAAGREEHCKHKSLVYVGIAHSVWATLGLAPLTVCVLSWSTLIRLQVALQGNCLKRALGYVHFPGLSCSGSGSQVLHKDTDSVGPLFCALPRSEQLSRPGAWRVHIPQVGRCVLSPPQSQPLGFLGEQQEHSLRCVVCLWGADLWLQPSWWMSTVQDPRKTWLTTGNLFAVWYGRPEATSGAEFAPSGSGCHLPASLPLAGDWLVCCGLALLWHSLSPLFCEWASSALG